MDIIRFNIPPYIGSELDYIREAITSTRLSGDNAFTKRCQEWFENHLGCSRALLTSSCTHALEMAALLIDIQPGDEVIMPSYTFVSTANAFVLRGARIVFVDIRSNTKNIDETLIESAITPKTKAIVPVHYAGVGCEMDRIMEIAERHNLFVVEDAAQGMMAKYKGRPLGTLGHLGTYSFHESKNYTSGGEGGLLIINDQKFTRRAEIIREKGTNRSEFFRGEAKKYSWMDIGSSYLPSELQAAYLWGQLEQAQDIKNNRIASWGLYRQHLQALERSGEIGLPQIPAHCEQNGHMFQIKMPSANQRSEMLAGLNHAGISAVFHYIPLHSSEAGRKFGRFHGDDRHTTDESRRIIRLPLFYRIEPETVARICKTVENLIVKTE